MFPVFAPRGLWTNPHLQTLSAAAPLGAPPRALRHHASADCTIALPDGDALLARAWWHDEVATARPAVVLLHGVGGTSESRYLRRAAAFFHTQGAHVVRLNARLRPPGAMCARRVAHGALFADLRVAVAWAAALRVDAVHVVGFSLGGHAALHLAASCSTDALPALRTVTAVSPPLDLTVVSRLFERPDIALYRAHVLRGLRRDVRAHLRRDPRALPVTGDAPRRWRQVRDYDEQVLAPLWGFASAADYYTRSSAALVLPAITLPTLLLHAADDPMVPAAAVTPFLAGAGPGLRNALTRHGGHCGFVTSWRTLARAETWATTAALAFQRAHDPR